MAPQLQNPLLPAGSLVLVTAANGLLASHIVDQLLLYGYKVRGTVRSLSRSSWLESALKKRHPNASLEIIEVADIKAAGCYDDAMKGVSAVIHTAADTRLDEDESTIPTNVGVALNALEAAAKANKNGEKIKRVVLTSSSWAVTIPQPNKKMDYTYDTYDTHAQELLDDPKTPAGVRGLMTYALSKVRTEQGAWKWVKEHKDCGFEFNTVLPGTCIGPVLSPDNQAYNSTVGFVRLLWEGKSPELFDMLAPQWYVDVRDQARLHVAGALLDGVVDQRIFACAEKFTWPQIAGLLEKEMGKPVPIQPKDVGEDLSTCPQERSVEYLKRMGLEGWEKLEDSVALNVRSFYPKE